MILASKRVLITGSTMGIGRAAAKAMLDTGARVALHGRKLERVQAVIEELGASGRSVAVCGDVGIAEDCRRLVESAVAGLGGLDFLVCNAGIGDLSYPEFISEEHWDTVMNCNCRSGYLLTKYALPALRESRGRVLFISSASAVCAGPTDSYAYAISKAGLASLAQSLAVELAPDGIQVNALCPGYINTPLIQAENEVTGGQIHRFVEQATLLGRIGTEDECASTIAYLASEGAAYFTGVAIVNDGGLSAQRSWGGRN